MPEPVDNVAASSEATSAWANSIADAVNELIGDLYAGVSLAIPFSALTGVPAVFTPDVHDHSSAAAGGLVPWGSVSGKPATFAPTAHASSHSSGSADALTPAVIGAWQKGSAGGGSAGVRIWTGTTDPGGSAVEGDLWVKG